MKLPEGFALILGSSSRSRAAILEEAKIPFTVVVQSIDEKALGERGHGADPKDLVMMLARAKADALMSSGKIKEGTKAMVVTCDQVAVWKGIIREKPVSAEQAREYLKTYADAPAETVGGIVVINAVTGKRVEGIDVAKQHFHPIPDSVIDTLIEKGDVFYCCGGFMIDEPLLGPYLAVASIPLIVVESALLICYGFAAALLRQFRRKYRSLRGLPRRNSTSLYDSTPQPRSAIEERPPVTLLTGSRGDTVAKGSASQTSNLGIQDSSILRARIRSPAESAQYPGSPKLSESAGLKPKGELVTTTSRPLSLVDSPSSVKGGITASKIVPLNT
ncbi:hypothetical protein HDU76_012487, partial [Blyttiomyces sp. JEL0837]